MDMVTYAVLAAVPGTRAARMIDPGSGIVAKVPLPPALDAGILVYYEGNRYGSANLVKFEDRVLCAAQRLHEHYPTTAMAVLPREEFRRIGWITFTFLNNGHVHHVLEVGDQALLDRWLCLKPEIFKQTVPCDDCPFRKEGGVRHNRDMMASYVIYFTTHPGATFPCHKSVDETDPRDKWSDWQPGQVLCAGGLLMAAKLGYTNGVIDAGVANGWYDPSKHTPEALALVFDTPSEMIDG